MRRFQPKMHQKRLAAGLRLDPIGELTALPQTSKLDLTAGTGTKDGGRGKTGGYGHWTVEGGLEDRWRKKGAEGEEGRKRVGGGDGRINLTPTVILKSRRLCRAFAISNRALSFSVASIKLLFYYTWSFTASGDEISPKLLPRDEFHRFTMPHKCVGGRSSAPDPARARSSRKPPSWIWENRFAGMSSLKTLSCLKTVLRQVFSVLVLA